MCRLPDCCGLNNTQPNPMTTNSTSPKEPPPERITHERITIVIPTYNEADNLPDMAQALFALGFKQLQLLVVDDNSPDGTGDIAEQLVHEYGYTDKSQQRARVHVIRRPDKSGLGTAYVAGMRRALDDGAKYIVQMDADFSHSPHYIPQMLDVLTATDADLVVGSRYVPGGSLDEGWAGWRRFVSWFANFYSRLILGLRIRDMTAGFKLWRREALLDIEIETIRSNGYSFQVEMACVCERLGYHIIELPIHFEDRRIGQSKMDIPIKIESGWRTWQIAWRYRNLSRKVMTYHRSIPRNRSRQPTVITWGLADVGVANSGLARAGLANTNRKEQA